MADFLVHLAFYPSTFTLLLLLFLPTTSCMFSAESLVHTREHFILKGQVIRRQRAIGVLSCAHLCLGEQRCVSFNYEMSSQKRGLCELSRGTAGHSGGSLTQQVGWIYGEMMRSVKEEKADVHVTFTSLGAKGRRGPQDASGYKGTPLEDKVQLVNGIQKWTVPVTGTYSVEVWGASGANGSGDNGGAGWTLGGKGARIKGHFKLNAGDKLKILVGQEGQTGSLSLTVPGSGGGGTFVINADGRALVIAGGGGGGAPLKRGEVCSNGDPGQATENGTRHGGYSGSGGKRCPHSVQSLEGAGGGGLKSDGDSSGTSTGGSSFLNGGLGGKSRPGVSNGGFGGGGAATSDPGGGGGYSGGGVESKEHKEHNVTVAGGGGSYNDGTSQENSQGVRQGDGQVTIKLIE